MVGKESTKNMLMASHSGLLVRFFLWNVNRPGVITMGAVLLVVGRHSCLDLDTVVFDTSVRMMLVTVERRDVFWLCVTLISSGTSVGLTRLT